MKVFLRPLHSKLNAGVGNCPLGCEAVCRVTEQAPELQPPSGHSCPLSSHQAETYALVKAYDADIIFNKSATGDGKSLGASLASLLNPNFRMMGLYPTIELVEDQAQQQKKYHKLFGLDAKDRVDVLFGEELSRRVEEQSSNKFKELLDAIEDKAILLTNPDIFHFIVHYGYRDPAYTDDELPATLATFIHLWLFDEFHIFAAHQEASALNSLTFLRRANQKQSKFLFTSATPKQDFIQQLKEIGFKVAEVRGVYASEATPGYRPILQGVELEFIHLKDSDSLQWLGEGADRIRGLLEAESPGRGLIILNSIATVARAVRDLSARLPGVRVREISGRIDRSRRLEIQDELKNSAEPVLIVATSAVDVGVDFRIHLLIFESSDAATVVQRLGRLGRHPEFSRYCAFLLVPDRVTWVLPRLKESLTENETIERSQLQEAIADAFEPPKAFAEYRDRWGALQAQGMFDVMSRENSAIGKDLRDRMAEDLALVYSSDRLEKARKQWYLLTKDETGVGKAIQRELLRFRGGTPIQAAVWDSTQEQPSFYTYDLLRLLPNAMVEILDRNAFLAEAAKSDRPELAFPEKYIQVYLKIVESLDKRQDICLETNLYSEDLKTYELSLLEKLAIVGRHLQPEVSRCLNNQELLAFLVPIDKIGSHWRVRKKLRLSPLFGLYKLTDVDNQTYACAFNQDALLLDALKWQLRRSSRRQGKSLIF